VILDDDEVVCIHVRPDGSELRFKRPPDRYDRFSGRILDDDDRCGGGIIKKKKPKRIPPPHFIVTVRGDFEFTVTSNRGGGHFIPIVSIPPPGVGWKIWDSTSDHSTLWRRPVARRAKKPLRRRHFSQR
jgi:hypothetical protein